MLRKFRAAKTLDGTAVNQVAVENGEKSYEGNNESNSNLESRVTDSLGLSTCNLQLEQGVDREGNEAQSSKAQLRNFQNEEELAHLGPLLLNGPVEIGTGNNIRSSQLHGINL
ncbi:hypothetical protein RHMOL_Rhmol10G0232400 [Rhododendron molle]|uniref:Uncharacterized protein n=1 Tax=Rhododendron molle TaxID=49168 RepID=A0ACC0M721_RHOML|nr:hypothetical protein RHMOL_Rhmol10G0232400 [Rhododendron molle]